MLEREPRHLTSGELIEAAGSGPPREELDAHLRECEECRLQLQEWRESVAALAGVREDARAELPEECPAMETLANYCAGAATEAEAAKVLAHLAQCARCAAIARVATETGPEAEIPAGADALGGRPWREQITWQWARNRRVWHPSWYAAAAGIVLMMGIAAWWLLGRARRPEALLASAYTEARPFEYWLPDRGYGPIRQQRGAASVFNRPESLISADMAIQQLLSGHADDARALALEGRAQLLEQDYQRAVASLTRAAELAPESTDVLVDLGCALALGGDVEKNPADHRSALDALSRALGREPRNQRALFNAAIVHERLGQTEEARLTWRKLLERRPPEGWAEEARAHLEALDKLRP